MIVGAQRSGSTSLHYSLKQHPFIYLPEIKDISHWVDDKFICFDKLAIFYRTYAGQFLVGGSNIQLMYFPNRARALYEYNPDLKLIAILRNPVERAYSSYWFARSNGWEPCKTFEGALEQEDFRLSLSLREQCELTHLTHGHYYEQLMRFLEFFSQEQLYIGLTADLKKDPRGTIDCILEFLEIEPVHWRVAVDQKSNAASIPNWPLLHHLFLSIDGWHKQLIRRTISPALRYFIRLHIQQRIMKWNLRYFKYPPMSPKTRKMLNEYYASHNKKLSELLGRDLSEWS
jgi:hypothetical protein